MADSTRDMRCSVYARELETKFGNQKLTEISHEDLLMLTDAISIRAAVKLLFLTMVRKSELTNATWNEINFSEALWTTAKERMKRRTPHLVFLSRQALDILIALKTFSGGSDYILPSRYDSDLPMSCATLNRVMTMTYTLAQKEGKPLAKFGPHDLRRTASTLLHEAGYNTDWIENALLMSKRA